MKTSSCHFFARATLALFLTLTFAVQAQEKQKSGLENQPPTPETPAAAAPAPAVEAPPAPAAVPAEPTEPAAPSAAAVEAEKTDTNRKGLRRLDQPAKGGSKSEGRRRTETRARGSNNGEVPFGDHTVAKGSQRSEAVSIFGSTTVEGVIRSDAVAVFGDTRVGPEATVGGAAVAVLGHLYVDGDVRQDAVSVLGGLTINGTVGGEAVSVLGDVHLGPTAVVNGDLVLVGGKLTKEPGAVVRGNEVNVPGFGALGSAEWLTTWLRQCAFKGRPLGFGPHLGWAWLIALTFLGFYLLLALLFPKAIEKCALTLETRPGGSVLASVLTVLLSPVATVLLALTVIGVALVPFLAAGLFFAGLFGKAVMMAWIGRRFTKFFGDGPLGHPVFAVLIGGVLVMLLYTIWGSFLLYKLISWIGLGVVVYTIALAMKREKPATPPGGATVPPPTPVVPPTPILPATPVAPAAPTAMAMSGAAAPTVSAGFTGPEAMPSPAETGMTSGFMSQPLPPLMGATPPVVLPVAPAPVPPSPEGAASTLPRAGFFIRLAALAIDGVLIGMIVGFTSGLLPRFLQFNHGPGGVLLALAIYGAVMWKHKGTTIGGIVCGLKVVRLDSREIDWATAIVRALGCFLSLAVGGLGFIWVAIDDEKQSWHDKIAGTTVVLVPKGQSLI